MIPRGLVATYGLRACLLHCAGRCQQTREGDGGRVESRDARGRLIGVGQLLDGPAPKPGEMPSLHHHSPEQLKAMAQTGYGADLDVCDKARAELHQRGISC